MPDSAIRNLRALGCALVGRFDTAFFSSSSAAVKTAPGTGAGCLDAMRDEVAEGRWERIVGASERVMRKERVIGRGAIIPGQRDSR